MELRAMGEFENKNVYILKIARVQDKNIYKVFALCAEGEVLSQLKLMLTSNYFNKAQI